MASGKQAKNFDPKNLDKLLAPQGWITREAAATILKCSYSTIEGLERKGTLHPKFSSEGFVRLDPEEVEAVSFIRGSKPNLGPHTLDSRFPRAPGAIQARVIECIEAGWPPAQIVKQLKITFEEVRMIYLECKTDFNSLSPKEMEQARIRSEKKREKDEAHRRELEKLDAKSNYAVAKDMPQKLAGISETLKKVVGNT